MNKYNLKLKERWNRWEIVDCNHYMPTHLSQWYLLGSKSFVKIMMNDNLVKFTDSIMSAWLNGWTIRALFVLFIEMCVCVCQCHIFITYGFDLSSVCRAVANLNWWQFHQELIFGVCSSVLLPQFKEQWRCKQSINCNIISSRYLHALIIISNWCRWPSSRNIVHINVVAYAKRC